MSERVDQLLENLAASGIDRSLDQFDADVSRGLGQWQSKRRTDSALAPVRAASIGLALAIGAAVGGVATHPAGGSGGLAHASELAPSTLLDADR